MNKRILIVTDQFPIISTPFITNIVTGLLGRGVDVDIVSQHYGDFQVVHQKYIENKLHERVKYMEEMPQGIFNRFVKFIKLFPAFLLKNPLFALKTINIIKHKRHALSLKYFFEVYSFCKIKNYDIIHAQFGPLGIMMDRLRRDKVIGGKLITHFRGYDISRLLRFEPQGYYNNLFKSGDLFLANCHFFENKLIELGAPKDKIRVLYSGVDIASFKYCKDYSIPVNNNIYKLCTVSRLSAKKGISYILDALNMLRLKRPDIHFEFNIIGEGEEREKIQKKIISLNLEKQVNLLGKKNHDYISKFLVENDVFISHNVTSDIGDQDAPVNTIKEAYLAKLPVISTFHGGISELVFDGISGFLVEEKDYKMLVEKIIILYDNSYLRKEFGNKGYDFVLENFDNEKISNQLINYYNQLVGS